MPIDIDADGHQTGAKRRQGRLRVLVAQLEHESHAFNPTVTQGSEFVTFEGEDILRTEESALLALGGILNGARERRVEIVPTIASKAVPSGPVDHRFYLQVKHQIIAGAIMHAPDVICLALHGALRTTELADAEGDLLESIRIAAPEALIGAVLDMHAIITERMLENCDVVVGYKTNPHIDIFQSGR